MTYDFKHIEPDLNITPEWILNRISEETIFCYYFGMFELKKAYVSKLRKDRNPSVGFYLDKYGKVRYKDLATGDNFNCFDYVKALYRCNFRQALNIIAKDFGLINLNFKAVPDIVFEQASNINKEVKKETLIQFEPDNWNKENLLFWDFYEISEKELKENLVFPVKNLWINKNYIKPKNHKRYAYLVMHGEKTYVKIYTPTDKNFKWVSNIPLNIPFGLESLNWNSDDNRIIITKSKKDLIVLKKLFTNVIATQNESEEAFPQGLQDDIKTHFKKRIVIFDNDDVGVNACKKFNDKGFDYFNIPKNELVEKGIKDCSDYVKWYGIEALKNLFIYKNIL